MKQYCRERRCSQINTHPLLIASTEGEGTTHAHTHTHTHPFSCTPYIHTLSPAASTAHTTHTLSPVHTHTHPPPCMPMHTYPLSCSQHRRGGDGQRRLGLSHTSLRRPCLTQLLTQTLKNQKMHQLVKGPPQQQVASFIGIREVNTIHCGRSLPQVSSVTS